jgi:hypothetical protein
MDESIQNAIAQSIGPWPLGWPLPLSAICPTMRWEDMVEFYFAYCAAEWGSTPGPAVSEQGADEEERLAA